MSLSQELKASLEAINFQSGLLFKELTEALHKVRTDGADDLEKALLDSNINALVKQHTGMFVTVGYHGARYPNAWVMPPKIDKNHPLLGPLTRFDEASMEGLAWVRSNKGVLRGTVDRKTGKVGGSFSDIETPIFLTRGILESDKFSDEEVAAVALHELGHLFTYYEYLGTMFTTNFVLQCVANEITGTNDIKRKYQVVDEANRTLNIKLDDVESLVSSDSKEVIQTVVLKKVMEDNKNISGASTYDMTGYEMLSDQFANRHGAGRALITALDKISKSVFNPSAVSTFTYLMMEVIKLMFTLALLASPSLIFVLMGLFGSDSNHDTYDKTAARIKRVRNDLVAALKDKDIDKEFRTRVLEDIAAIDEVASKFKDRRTWLQVFHTHIRKGGRAQHQQKLLQQDLEKLARNNLFVSSSKIESLI